MQQSASLATNNNARTTISDRIFGDLLLCRLFSRRGGRALGWAVCTIAILFVFFFADNDRRGLLAQRGAVVASSSSRATTTTPNTKYILYYTNYFAGNDFHFGVGREAFVNYPCPVNDCYAQPRLPIRGKNAPHNFTPGPAMDYGDYDAVLFHVVGGDFPIANKSYLREIRAWRKPHQRFVFVMMESQNGIYNQFDLMDGFFNWTMTFKWDSDIPRPYGWFQPKQRQRQRQQQYEESELSSSSSTQLSSSFVDTQKEEQEPITQQQQQLDDLYFYPYLPKEWIPYNQSEFWATLPHRDEEFLNLARRPLKVAWIVSNCNAPSGRDRYAKAMRRLGVQVDQFGKCKESNMQVICDDECSRAVERDYKFYLSFENILCNDYVTEKFFRRAHSSIPIVLGQANYTAVAPPHSFVNVFDYTSVKALVDHVNYLDANDEAYLSYFWWRDHYDVLSETAINDRETPQRNQYGRAMCRLCQKLHQEDNNNNKVYDDMNDWWRGRAQCGAKWGQLYNTLYKS